MSKEYIINRTKIVFNNEPLSISDIPNGCYAVNKYLMFDFKNDEKIPIVVLPIYLVSNEETICAGSLSIDKETMDVVRYEPIWAGQTFSKYTTLMSDDNYDNEIQRMNAQLIGQDSYCRRAFITDSLESIGENYQIISSVMFEKYEEPFYDDSYDANAIVASENTLDSSVYGCIKYFISHNELVINSPETKLAEHKNGLLKKNSKF